MHNDPTKFCRVCGLEQAHPQYGMEGKSPSYEICDCCGVEFGYEDCTIESALEFRKNWLSSGKEWFTPKEKPIGWSWELQKEQVPADFRDGKSIT